MRSTVVIPARLHSTRLPRKLLLEETGKPLIQHTYESALKSRLPSDVLVAVDDLELFRRVEAFGGNVRMTSPEAASGTDRVAEVARAMDEIDIVVNVQGDEPEISGEAIDLAIRLLEADPPSVMSTLATPIRDLTKLNDPSCVKVVFDQHGRAMYFSRSPIPHARQWDDRLLAQDPPLFYQHIGLYAYRRDFLLSVAKLPQSPLECLESLEQLRVLSAGYSIAVGAVDEPTVGIDTREDYESFLARRNLKAAA